MTRSQLKQFLESRPAIKHSGFAKECGIETSRFHRMLKGTRPMSPADSAAAYRVAVKYGMPPLGEQVC